MYASVYREGAHNIWWKSKCFKWNIKYGYKKQARSETHRNGG